MRTLRRYGVDVHVVSVRECDRSLRQLSSEEAEEAQRTFSVLGAGTLHALIANLRVLLRHPIGYLKGLILRARPWAVPPHSMSQRSVR